MTPCPPPHSVADFLCLRRIVPAAQSLPNTWRKSRTKRTPLHDATDPLLEGAFTVGDHVADEGVLACLQAGPHASSLWHGGLLAGLAVSFVRIKEALDADGRHPLVGMELSSMGVAAPEHFSRPAATSQRSVARLPPEEAAGHSPRCRNVWHLVPCPMPLAICVPNQWGL